LADFFSEFAVALNQKDASKVSDYYYTPSIFVSRGTKQVCSDWQQLVKFNQQFIDQFLLKELNERTLKIVKTLKLSKKLFFCMVEWQYEDENEMVAIDTRMSFTLKKEGDSQFKIMVTVLIETVDDVNALLAV
jgi:ketosteroid isomerase-like protein